MRGVSKGGTDLWVVHDVCGVSECTVLFQGVSGAGLEVSQDAVYVFSAEAWVSESGDAEWG